MQYVILFALKKNIEILLEVDSKEEFELSIKRNADIIGINNRDLETLEIDMNKTIRILEEFDENYDKPIITESASIWGLFPKKWTFSIL